MPSTLADKNVAILAADGFDEHQMTEIQRALVKAGARLKTVAQEPGVVNGWQGDTWGHHFHVDAPIGEALGSDFDMLVLPGGMRGAEKLRQNPHTRRIVNHFIEANKADRCDRRRRRACWLCAIRSKGRTVAAPETAADALKAAGASIDEDNQYIDGNILTADGEELTAWVDEAIAFFGDAELIRRAA